MATTVPSDVAENLALRGAMLSEVIPPKDASNLLIATWNLRAMGGLTAKWHSDVGDSPARNWYAVACIAQIVSRFDVIAIQEVRRTTTALRFLLEQLGDEWRVIVSDVTEGGPGNGERLTFLYDSTRVQASGLVGEIVLPATVQGPTEQFARTPYVASFSRGSAEFTLTTLHVIWGANAQARLPEIAAFAEWMRAWADRPHDWNDNLLVLGDFNLDRIGDPLFEAFVSTGLWPPAELNDVPRTVFDNDRSKHFYDQIAWFSGPNGASLLHSLTYSMRAGSFDFLPNLLGGLTRSEQSWRISDHYPLWVEFRLPP
ncbi:endonuclease/exonuclease/phosphatase family protein [Mycetocola miduiensis]|uniref:Metal-dependent hydrolase, endonuclease/exonuclease/phosphatase family n=1 Tax=Mycetocola miduiensis TaxID=995034 RepID=A0A1I5ADM8_9MICO|nr:endonuclease/exonuclease/phosphatase family protein [Mycetocola miduiensis]SFN60566.1 Metal-dependent hydrolase, endonuclease/exonuclease/phosphatase family [Mycetocola miduiensis]